jgi:PKD repeat protein
MNGLKRYTKTLFCSVGFLVSAFVAGCGGGDQGRGPILGLPAADLVTVAVTPATPAVAIGGAQQLVATATYSDGSSRDVTSASAWTSATPAVATVNGTTGAARGVAPGTAAITATFGNKAGSATLTVTGATLVSVAVAPATPSIGVGATQQFVALGTFSDNTTRDITAISTFASATPAVATIGASSALATGVTPGSTLISATSGARSGSTTLTVTPAVVMSLAIAPVNPTVQIGATRQLAVIASYSDNTTVDVTSSSVFTSATPAVATVAANTGLATGVAAGTSVVSAAFGGKTVTTTVTVPVATLASIAVTPATASVAVGGTQQFVATATYSDNSTAIITTTVSWTSGTTAVGTILPTGIATGVAAGSTTISASSDGRTGSAVLDVTAVIPPPAGVGIDLGRAASFGVLAGTSITNNSGGTTVINGDVGSPSQTTDPVQSAGVNYKSGAILDGALADLQVAISDANSRTCDVSLASGINLGGQVLAPGVYCFTGAITLTGTFTMNGPGLYIFRTASTLDTTANSVVALTGGASADNVFWVPVGPTTLGANSVFKGSILGQSAAITLGDNATMLNGRVLTAAAATLRNNQITK